MKKLLSTVLAGTFVCGAIPAFADDIKYLAEPVFDFRDVGEFHDGLAPVSDSGDYGFVNINGDIVIETSYDGAENFSEGLAVVELNDQYGAINPDGKVVIPIEYDDLSSCREGLLAAKRDGATGYLDKEGETAIPFQYATCADFSDGLAFVESKNGEQGFIDLGGRTVFGAPNINLREGNNQRSFDVVYDAQISRIDFVSYLDTPMFSEGLLAVECKILLDTLYGDEDAYIFTIMNKTGDILYLEPLEEQFGQDNRFSSDLLVSEYGIYHPQSDSARGWPHQPTDRYISSQIFIEAEEVNSHYINREGYIVEHFIYDEVGMMSEELAVVKHDGKYGYISRGFNEVVPPSFDEAFAFSNGLGRVERDGKYGYVRKSGRMAYGFEFEDARCFSEGAAFVKVDGNWGILANPDNQPEPAREVKKKAEEPEESDEQIEPPSPAPALYLPDDPDDGSVKVYVDGTRLALEQPPVLEDGHTLVPMRAVFEALGADVVWNGADRTITATQGGVAMFMIIDNRTTLLNNTPVLLDTPPVIMNESAFVPLRAVAECFCKQVSWDGQSRTVQIVS